jgi:hypothetical protein
MKQVGDTFYIEATGDFAPGIECIIMEMEDGRITKAKAAVPDERLLKLGFLIEGENYIIQEWKWCREPILFCLSMRLSCNTYRHSSQSRTVSAIRA